MRVAAGLARLGTSGQPALVAVGVFDGLHLGHQYLLARLVEEAAARGARPVVVTFDHHPDELLRGSAPPLLCDPEERLARMAEAGVETVVVVHFDEQMRHTAYDAFVAQLRARGPLAGFLMTPDAAFGYQRGGTPATLAALGRAQGFEVVVVPPFELDGQPVRSTEVREAISAGDLGRAAALLGRPHSVIGEAVPDPQGRGSVLRFALPVALPPEGRYEAESDRGRGPRGEVVAVGDGSVLLPEAPGAAPGQRTRVALLRAAPAARPAPRG